METSAIAAIVRKEPTEQRIKDLVAAAPDFVVAAHCRLEIALAFSLKERRLRVLHTLVEDPGCRTVDLPTNCATLLEETALRYGKGSGHKAQLNFGDCMSYAVAKSLDLPLLFVGDDFTHTDVESVL